MGRQRDKTFKTVSRGIGERAIDPFPAREHTGHGITSQPDVSPVMLSTVRIALRPRRGIELSLLNQARRVTSYEVQHIYVSAEPVQRCRSASAAWLVEYSD